MYFSFFFFFRKHPQCLEAHRRGNGTRTGNNFTTMLITKSNPIWIFVILTSSGSLRCAIVRLILKKKIPSRLSIKLVLQKLVKEEHTALEMNLSVHGRKNFGEESSSRWVKKLNVENSTENSNTLQNELRVVKLFYVLI